MTRSPQINTLRRRLAATRELLQLVEEELEDLHVLAYDRPTARREAAVAGGTVDYALDTHGDPRARDAYRHLGQITVDACDQLADAAHEAIVLLRARDDSSRPRTRRTIRAEELAGAIEAKAKRVERGEYEPVRRYPQPDRDETLRSLRSELAPLRAVVRERTAKGWAARGHPANLRPCWERPGLNPGEMVREPMTDDDITTLWPHLREG